MLFIDSSNGSNVDIDIRSPPPLIRKITSHQMNDNNQPKTEPTKQTLVKRKLSVKEETPIKTPTKQNV